MTTNKNKNHIFQLLTSHLAVTTNVTSNALRQLIYSKQD